jgi:hypothetical protein
MFEKKVYRYIMIGFITTFILFVGACGIGAFHIIKWVFTKE